MLNSRLLFISSENYSNYFKVFVAANPYANGIRGYCSIKTETIDPYGDIKPKRFMGLKITEFNVTSDRSTQQISVGIENVTEIPEDKSLFIKRFGCREPVPGILLVTHLSLDNRGYMCPPVNFFVYLFKLFKTGCGAFVSSAPVFVF